MLIRAGHKTKIIAVLSYNLDRIGLTLLRKIGIISAVALLLCTSFIISTTPYSTDAISRSASVSASGDYKRTYTIHNDYGYSTSFYITIPKETYQYYKSEPHTCHTYDDFKKFVTDEMFTDIVPSLSMICTTDYSFITATLEITQQIPYDGHDTELYPLETLVENAGDCSDKSYIAASILVAKGYYTILLHFELDDVDHMAIGVAVSVFEVDYTARYWEHKGKEYYYCECTDLGWRIGELPSDLQNEGAIIIDVGGYKQAQITASSQFIPIPPPPSPPNPFSIDTDGDGLSNGAEKKILWNKLLQGGH